MRVRNTPALLVVGVVIGTLSPSATRAEYIFTTFDFPGGPPSTANGINNAGAIVGFSGTPPTTPNFIRNPNGTFTSLNIGNDAAAMANGINVANTVAGVTGAGLAFSLTAGSTTPRLLPSNPGEMSSVALLFVS